MKLMIASDLHGSDYWCARMLEAFETEQPERLMFLGDILYHGPRNDLPREYAPKQVIAKLTPLKDRILCVRGNCDCEVDQMVLPFPVSGGLRLSAARRQGGLSRRTDMSSTRRIRCRLRRAIFCCTGTRMCPPARTAAILRI